MELLMWEGRSTQNGSPPALDLGLTSCCTLCCFSGSPRTTGGFSTSSWGVAWKWPGAEGWHLRRGPQGSLPPAPPVSGRFPPHLTLSKEIPAREVGVLSAPHRIPSSPADVEEQRLHPCVLQT